MVQIFPKRVRFYPILINFGYNQAIFTYQAGGSPEVVESEESERLDETLRLRSEIVRIKAQGAALGFPGGTNRLEDHHLQNCLQMGLYIAKL